MENNFNSKEVSEFLNKIELNEENVMDVIEFIHYKSSLQTMKYIIELIETSSDTSNLVINYVETMKKVEKLIEKIIEKNGNTGNE